MLWQPRQVTDTLHISRYATEFEELEFLGKGGFGRVVKALNKLDKNLYAIKKINLPRDVASESKLLREVTTWSKLSHPSVVRYQTSWVETDSRSVDVVKALREIESSQSEPATTDSGPSAFDVGEALDSLDELDFSSLHGPISANNSSYPQIHFGHSSDGSDAVATAPSLNKDNIVAVAEPEQMPPTTPIAEKRILMIQMEYVDGITLREAIDDRRLSQNLIWSILRQILHAIVSFHSQNIVHRDLKPTNIFLDQNALVKIGDFGLAVETASALIHAQATDVMEQSDLTSGTSTIGLRI